MQTLMLDPAVPFLVGAAPRFHVVVVGAGGTGSYVVQHLARMMSHCAAMGGPDISATVFDGDGVEPKNVGRQLFAPAEVGRNKAMTLAARFNAALGLRITAVARMATSELLTLEVNQSHRDCCVLVGCVDGAEGRKEMAAALKDGMYDLWIDSGNHEASGQVVVGGAAEMRKMHGAFALGGLCSALPAPSLLYPHLLKAAKPRPRQDCAAAVEDNRQSLTINAQMAAIVSQYLTQIVLKRRLMTYETTVDVDAGTMRSTPITAANLAQALGLSIDELTQGVPYGNNHAANQHNPNGRRHAGTRRAQ